MGNQILKGKKGIIFGALDDKSIAWKVAEKAYSHGGEIVLTNAPIALRKKDIYNLAEKTNSSVIPADVTNIEDIEKLLNESVEILNGKIDFVLHSVAMSPNVRKRIPYTQMNYAFFDKTIDISAISLHKILSSALKNDILNEQASVVTLSYIAAHKFIADYGDMTHSKALLESIVKQFGYYYGIEKKVRVNAVSQSPTPTSATSIIPEFKKLYDYSQKVSPLGNASAESCADVCIMLFSDFTKMITMQTIYNDGGFSAVGISEEEIGLK